MYARTALPRWDSAEQVQASGSHLQRCLSRVTCAVLANGMAVSEAMLRWQAVPVTCFGVLASCASLLPVPMHGVVLSPSCHRLHPTARRLHVCVCVRTVGVAVSVQAFEDRSFTFDVLPPPTSWYLKRVTGVAKGAKMPGKEVAGSVSLRALYEIALSQQQHNPTLAVLPTQSIVRSLCGSAKSMGLKLVK
jgi:hypothetical protein